MSDIKIYLDLAPDIQAALADNHLSVADLLAQAQIDADVTHGVLPSSAETGERTKELVTVIMAGSLGVAAITYAISHFLQTIYSRPYLIEYEEWEAVHEGDGTVLRDAFGQPIFRLVQKHELVEPKRDMPQFGGEFKFDPSTNAVVARFGSLESTQESQI